ncbi:vomeronasal type-2 receptor 26-like [Ahaetulla prasina]|uniref:vomeronasal type-2 receptor 26-like n=1 Tax=Ahaetulla prasina TaxID=499056 RepID=UPI0026495A71|nr:vomeronasal type-2 receptor 26-like [Ahaetulla prasina]
MASQIGLASFFYQESWDIQVHHGALSFAPYSNEVAGFQHFIQTRNHFSSKEDFLKDVWEQSFGCVFPNPPVNNETENVCTGREKLEILPGVFFEMRMTSHSYSIYNAVYAVAHALHAMKLGQQNRRKLSDKKFGLQDLQSWQCVPRAVYRDILRKSRRRSLFAAMIASHVPKRKCPARRDIHGPLACKTQLRKCRIQDPIPIVHNYLQPGDLTIGAITSLVFINKDIKGFEEDPRLFLAFDSLVLIKYYQHILTMIFAVKMINENLQLLPNITLGFNIYESYGGERTYHASIELSSSQKQFIPNYKCGILNKLISVVGTLDPAISDDMADILIPYKIPLFPTGSSPYESPFYYNMVPSENIFFMGIIRLLLYCRWTWVGLFMKSFEAFLQHLIVSIFPFYGICVAFLEQFRLIYIDQFFDGLKWLVKSFHIYVNSRANAIIVSDKYLIHLRWLLRLPEIEMISTKPKGKVWIMTSRVDLASFLYQKSWDIQVLHGALTFAAYSNEVEEFQNFIQTRNHFSSKEDGFLKNVWEQAFGCAFPNPSRNEKNDDVCTGNEKLENLPGAFFEMKMTSHSYSIYNAVHAVSHALHDMELYHQCRRKLNGRKHSLQDLQPWQLHFFLERVSFNNNVGDEISFNENGELVTGLDLENWVTFPNQSLHRVKVGKLDPWAAEDQMFTIHEEAIIWPSTFNQTLPISVCTDSCPPGYFKRKQEEKPFCCYDCLRCPKEKMSSQKDMADCSKCPEDQYPNKLQDSCLPKKVVFLSYEEPMGIALVTLFLVAPGNIICLFRQISFGIIFSVAVSSVLAKTITVVLAFMATKPGSRMRKWVGRGLATSIVLSGSLIQAAICIIWLFTFPPFLDTDTHSEIEEIILQCNEGSSTMFYCVLGYMGFLAAASFTVAFFSRNLPSSFNEAKCLTFSMLIFCSVWLSFVPSYLSTKGKYMVAVEIFSILASSAGLLVCIYFPKCYIIIVRPELNNKEQLIKRR